MYRMKCSDSFKIASLRGVTVGLNSEWSVWDDYDKTKAVWVVVDPILGKKSGDLIPKIWWPYLKDEKNKQDRAAAKEKAKAKSVKEDLEKETRREKKKSEPKVKVPRRPDFFNPFAIQG
jgi:hypothetical protein